MHRTLEIVNGKYAGKPTSCGTLLEKLVEEQARVDQKIQDLRSQMKGLVEQLQVINCGIHCVKEYGGVEVPQNEVI